MNQPRELVCWGFSSAKEATFLLDITLIKKKLFFDKILLFS